MTKIKVGFFGLSGCAGCLLSVLFEDVFLKINEMINIVSFSLIKEEKYKGKLDLSFVEGTVVFDKDILLLNEIRKRTKFLVAFGSCACFGGVPSEINFKRKEEIIRLVYPKYNHLKSEPPTPINKHVKVDYYLPQCPPNKEEIINFIECFLNQRKFRIKENAPVCFECRKKENPCMLEKGKVCLGPITRGGCNALCPSNDIGCYGCRGPNKDANYESFIRLLISKGYKKEDIKNKLETFAGLEFKEENEKITEWLEK
ncbi:MAG: oxidoreductase [Candidatus Pacearchaeota archaeon]